MADAGDIAKSFSHILPESVFYKVKDRYSADKDVEKHKAGDYSSYLGRLHSFTIHTWCAKPLWLSAPVCARYGWRNVDTDWLQCVTCRAFLHGAMPTAGRPRAYAAGCERLQESVIKAHHRYCSWISNPSPEHFMSARVPEVDAMRAQLDDVMSLSTHLPVFNEDILAHLGLGDEELAQAQERLGVEIATPEDKQVFQSALVLTLTGWSRDRSSRLAALRCGYCAREAGLCNYVPLNGADSSSEEEEDESDQAPCKKLAIDPNSSSQETPCTKLATDGEVCGEQQAIAEGDHLEPDNNHEVSNEQQEAVGGDINEENTKHNAPVFGEEQDGKKELSSDDKIEQSTEEKNVNMDQDKPQSEKMISEDVAMETETNASEHDEQAKDEENKSVMTHSDSIVSESASRNGELLRAANIERENKTAEIDDQSISTENKVTNKESSKAESEVTSDIQDKNARISAETKQKDVSIVESKETEEKATSVKAKPGNLLEAIVDKMNKAKQASVITEIEDSATSGTSTPIESTQSKESKLEQSTPAQTDSETHKKSDKIDPDAKDKPETQEDNENKDNNLNQEEVLSRNQDVDSESENVNNHNNFVGPYSQESSDGLAGSSSDEEEELQVQQLMFAGDDSDAEDIDLEVPSPNESEDEVIDHASGGSDDDDDVTQDNVTQDDVTQDDSDNDELNRDVAETDTADLENENNDDDVIVEGEENDGNDASSEEQFEDGDGDVSVEIMQTYLSESEGYDDDDDVEYEDESSEIEFRMPQNTNQNNPSPQNDAIVVIDSSSEEEDQGDLEQGESDFDSDEEGEGDQEEESDLDPGAEDDDLDQDDLQPSSSLGEPNPDESVEVEQEEYDENDNSDEASASSLSEVEVDQNEAVEIESEVEGAEVEVESSGPESVDRSSPLGEIFEENDMVQSVDENRVEENNVEVMGEEEEVIEEPNIDPATQEFRYTDQENMTVMDQVPMITDEAEGMQVEDDTIGESSQEDYIANSSMTSPNPTDQSLTTRSFLALHPLSSLDSSLCSDAIQDSSPISSEQTADKTADSSILDDTQESDVMVQDGGSDVDCDVTAIQHDVTMKQSDVLRQHQEESRGSTGEGSMRLELDITDHESDSDINVEVTDTQRETRKRRQKDNSFNISKRTVPEVDSEISHINNKLDKKASIDDLNKMLDSNMENTFSNSIITDVSQESYVPDNLSQDSQEPETSSGIKDSLNQARWLQTSFNEDSITSNPCTPQPPAFGETDSPIPRSRVSTPDAKFSECSRSASVLSRHTSVRSVKSGSVQRVVEKPLGMKRTRGRSQFKPLGEHMSWCTWALAPCKLSEKSYSDKFNLTQSERKKAGWQLAVEKYTTPLAPSPEKTSAELLKLIKSPGSDGMQRIQALLQGWTSPRLKLPET